MSSPHRVRAAAWRHPRMQLAIKTAAGAGVAWLLVQPLGGFVDDYPYYAPLGVVVAMSTSVVGSVRTALQAVAAIFTGAALGYVVHVVPLPGAVAVAIGIGAGVAMASTRVFGPMGSWVPFATLFVLIIGGSNPWRYAAAYGGLTALGAVIGILINLAFPQLPLTPAELAQERLRGQLADQLDLLADGLESEEVLSPEEWAGLAVALRPETRRVEDLVASATESRRANWRARRWSALADRREAQARALYRLTGCIDEILALVGDTRSAVHAADEVAVRLRTRTATALRAVAQMLRTVRDKGSAPDGPEAATSAAAQADQAVGTLAEEAALAAATDGQYLPAAVSVTLRHAVEAWS